MVLRKRNSGESLLQATDKLSTTTKIVYDVGTCSAVWVLGDQTFCKVKSWLPGMSDEAKTIAFVRTIAPTVPVPNVIHSWLEEGLNRSFLLMERVPRIRFAEAWPSLSSQQRIQTASQITSHVSLLATTTSDRYESADGRAIQEYHLAEDPGISSPSWKPHLIGPHDYEDYVRYLHQLAPKGPALNIDPQFCFYHNDLGPTNIFIEQMGEGSDEVRVTAIIDWESAAYSPRFLLSTRPFISGGFLLGDDDWDFDDRGAWALLLHKALEAEGFEGNVDGYVAWSEAATAVSGDN